MTHPIHDIPARKTVAKASSQVSAATRNTPVSVDGLDQAGERAPATPALLVVRYLCLHCGVQLSVSAEKVGKWARCQTCGNRMRVPNLPAEPGQPRMTIRRVGKRVKRKHRRKSSRLLSPVGEGISLSPAPPPAPAAPITVSDPPAPVASPELPEPSLPGESSAVVLPRPVPPARRLENLVLPVLEWASRLRRRRPGGAMRGSSSPASIMALYGDLVGLGILGGGFWWAVVAYTGKDFHGLALLPGLLVGLAAMLWRTDALVRRRRPAVAAAGIATLLALGLILATTQQAHQVRRLMDDPWQVSHAVILHMIQTRTLPEALQQEIDAHRWYDPQNPEAFFSAQIIPVYEQLQSLARDRLAQMHPGQRHRLFKEFLHQRDDPYWASWSCRLERANAWIGVWGMVGLSLAGGLSLLRERMMGRP